MATRQKTIRYSLGNIVTCEGDIDRVWMFTSSGSVWTDETTDAGDSGTGDVAFTGAVGDILYICHDEKFDAVWVDVTTAPAGGVRTWEYYNGSTWAALTNTYLTGNANLTADTSFYFTPPSDWTATAVNGDANRYAIRGRVTTLYTTAGTAAVISIAAYDNLIDGAAGSQKTIELTESTSGRTFRSVILKVWSHTPVSGQWDRWLVRARIGSGSWSNIESRNLSALVGLANETTAFVTYYDLTTLFSTDFTSTSHGLEVELAQLQRNVTATIDQNRRHYSTEVLITYDFDDTSTTQMNTVIIPVDSLNASLTTSQQNIGGTNGIPQLTSSGLLQEASITIKDLYIVYVANANEAGTTNYSFVAQMDSDTEVTLATFDAVNQSDFYAEIIWRQPSLTTTSAHTLKARVTSVTGAVFADLGAYVVVTYSYDESTSTKRTVSLQLPFHHRTNLSAATTSTDAEVSAVKFFVEDANVSLLQSGILMYLHQAGDPGTWNIATGSQTYRGYTAPPDTTSGPTSAVHRIDSGAAAGTGGFTLARGINTLTVKSYVTAAVNSGGECGILFLNYSADLTAGKRTQSCWHIVYASMAQAQRSVVSKSIAIPESSYWLNWGSAISTLLDTNLFGVLTRIALATGFSVPVAGPTGAMDSNMGTRFTVEPLTRYWKRWANDTDSIRVDIETSRNFVIEPLGQFVVRYSMLLVACWHDYSYSISGDISGSGGGTVNWEAYSKQLGEKIASGSRTGDGSYTATWFDDTSSDVFVTAREDATHVGRSDDGTPA